MLAVSSCRSLNPLCVVESGCASVCCWRSCLSYSLHNTHTHMQRTHTHLNKQTPTQVCSWSAPCSHPPGQDSIRACGSGSRGVTPACHHPRFSTPLCLQGTHKRECGCYWNEAVWGSVCVAAAAGHTRLQQPCVLVSRVCGCGSCRRLSCVAVPTPPRCGVTPPYCTHLSCVYYTSTGAAAVVVS